MADLLLNIIGSDQASTALRGVASGFQELAKLAAECTKQFEEQAKADRQLERYAGDLTGAFKAQASAMQEQLGVSDDMVEKMQTMLLRFGEAPESVEATTRALLDYSAATGTDAVQATQTLLTSVNSGKAAFKDLGLVYDSTGHKSADLVAVTNALAGKVGGSAKAEAGSLSGQTRIAIEAVNEFKESIGGLINEFVNKTGAVGTFTQAVKDMQVLLFGAQKDSLQGLQQNIDSAKEKLVSMQAGWRDALTIVSAGAFSGYTKEEVDAQIKLVETLEAEWVKANSARQRALGGDEVVGLGIHKDELTNKGKKSAEKEANDRKLSDFESFAEAKTRADFDFADKQKEALKDLAEARTKAQIEDQKRNLESEADEDKHFEKQREQKERELQYHLDMAEKAGKAEEKSQKDLRTKMLREAKETERQVMEAGTSIGLAFANALAGAILEAMDGGEIDVLGLMADIGFSVAAIAASTIANIYAPGTGTLVGGLVGTAGSVVHSARAKAWKQERGPKHHDGGWVGADRYHSGGWPGLATDEEPIVAQRGEAVLSRSDVQRMGGRGAVDRARKGAGGMHVTVVAQDSVSVREFFEDRGSRGITNAIRTGRGLLNQTLFGT